MHYIFILGRNPELSRAEIFSYFRKEGIKILGEQQIKNALRVEVSDTLDSGVVDQLGGTIAIARVLAQGNSVGLRKQLDSQEIYYGTKNKLNYCIWHFTDDRTYTHLSAYLKKRFREEKLKAVEKQFTRELEVQGEKSVGMIKSLVDEEYVVFGDCFGKIVEKSDYSEIEKRDMNKPQRREHLAISPRLAKIMINLSEVRERQTLLDPFCGVGVILFEALLQKVNVVGIDIDKKAIAGAQENIVWGKFDKKKYALINADSKKLKVKSVDVLVSEPHLGEVFKKAMNEQKAKEVLRGFERLMIKVLQNMKGSVTGKIVFSAPYIKLINKKRIGCDIEGIAAKTGLKLANSFKEYREHQIVGREIFVLENL